jgi:hypothetical protein
MHGILEALDGRDLLITFAIATVAGFAFVYLDNYALSKVESTIGIPAGNFMA